jgi:rhodanese-related sulfurtransferase
VPLKVLPEAARELVVDGAIYLDVRSEPEFAEGHPDGATNLPWARYTMSGLEPNPDFVALASLAFAKGQALVVGCKSGARSALAAAALEAAGFIKVVDQTAGFAGKRGDFGEVVVPGWVSSGLPVSTSGTRYRELLARLGRAHLPAD